MDFLYDAKILEDLDLSDYGLKFDGKTSVIKPGNNLTVRPLSTGDYEKGFISLLNQLTRAGDVTKQDFIDRFNGMKKNGDYYVIVVEDESTNKIVATGMLEIEQKFIHSCALRGRVEEVVVDDKYRGQRLGKLILGLVTKLSKKLGCYKCTLECTEENRPFYEKFAYVKDAEHYMQLRFRD